MPPLPAEAETPVLEEVVSGVKERGGASDWAGGRGGVGGRSGGRGGGVHGGGRGIGEARGSEGRGPSAAPAVVVSGGGGGGGDGAAGVVVACLVSSTNFDLHLFVYLGGWELLLFDFSA